MGWVYQSPEVVADVEFSFDAQYEHGLDSLVRCAKNFSSKAIEYLRYQNQTRKKKGASYDAPSKYFRVRAV